MTAPLLDGTTSLIAWAGGTRAILAITFTDLVDSTATADGLGDEAMDEVWTEHFEQSRKLITAHSGRWIKNLGDGDLAVFRTAEEALDYARALQSEPGSSVLRMRAGIHVGPVQVLENDIRGREVNFAARVGGANKSAEIWLSSEAIRQLGILKARRFANLRWLGHPGIELKGLGAYTLWSLSPTGLTLAEIAARDGRAPPLPRAEPSHPHGTDSVRSVLVAEDGHDHTVLKRATTAHSLGVGTALINGTYVIEEFLARGGMGEVYRARHSDHGTQHAIKVIVPALARNETVVQLFIREAGALERINNDAIVRYQGFLRDETGARYLVMEFVDGEPLGTVLRQRRLEPEEVLALLDRLGNGLAAAHELGIVHRDISPENIIVPRGDIRRAKLIDFGIAKSAGPGDPTLIGSDFAGKFSFVSPEQAGLFGAVVDLRSDIYSLGLVLAAAALGFGKRLDMGATPASVIQARQSVPDLSVLPPALRPIISHMLQPLPQDRPGSMRSVIEEAHTKTPAAASILLPPTRRRRAGRLAVWLGGTALAGAIALAVAVAGIRLAMPSIDEVRAALATTASGHQCADLSYSVGEDRVVAMSGYVATDSDLAGLRDTLAGLRGVAKLNLDVRRRGWPYCEVHAMLKPLFAAGNRGAAIGLASRGSEAYAGGALMLDLRAPDFDGYVYVDYYQANGRVVHLLPNAKDPINLKPARNRFVVGQPPTRNCAVFSGDPGEQLITLVASDRPLFASAFPETENAKEYLPKLSQALAKGASGQRSAVPLFFELRSGRAPNSSNAYCPMGS